MTLLKDVKTLLELITPGDWELDQDNNIRVKHGFERIAWVGWQNWQNDAAFIAKAPELVADLVWEVERLTDEISGHLLDIHQAEAREKDLWKMIQTLRNALSVTEDALQQIQEGAEDPRTLAGSALALTSNLPEGVRDDQPETVRLLVKELAR